jgi:hypothetical protein
MSCTSITVNNSLREGVFHLQLTVSNKE